MQLGFQLILTSDRFVEQAYDHCSKRIGTRGHQSPGIANASPSATRASRHVMCQSEAAKNKEIFDRSRTRRFSNFLNEWWWPNSRNLVRQMKFARGRASTSILTQRSLGGSM